MEQPRDEGWLAPKDERLVPYGDTNLGTPVELLDRTEADLVVPTEVFFVRSNYRIPTVDVDSWRLTVRGLVERPLELTLAELQAMPQRELVAFMECSGNSRTGFVPATPGTPWHDDAVGNATWTGIRLRDVLDLAGLGPGAVEVISQGADDPEMRRGLPMRAALDPDTLLALGMNGAPLLVAHGAPARLVVPGWGGIASTKWLVDLEVVDQHWNGKWNAEEYVLLDEDGTETGRVEEMPVKSVITSPVDGSSVTAGPVEISGYAWSGRGEVSTVEVSVDGGRTYAPAEITERPGPRAWVRWTRTVDAEPGELDVRSRAADTAGGVQPDVAPWNAKGYQMNAVAKITLTVR